MTIPLEKILNVDVRDYIESKGTQLSDYEMQGVFSQKGDIGTFAEGVPDETEVVVNYQFIPCGAASAQGITMLDYRQVGTALIPKKE